MEKKSTTQLWARDRFTLILGSELFSMLDPNVTEMYNNNKNTVLLH